VRRVRWLAAVFIFFSVIEFSFGEETVPATEDGAKGDPVRGRAIVANRQVGLCLLCHKGPFPEERFQGDLAPDLRGVGKRYTEDELRLRMTDPAKVNPATIMPSYSKTEGLSRVAPGFRGKPILTPEQIEDVVAYLASLRD
jgi:sulfur-oxidizing protein SoxX